MRSRISRCPLDSGAEATVENRFPCSFFFQAEDGIRDHCVTRVQTCALPISSSPSSSDGRSSASLGSDGGTSTTSGSQITTATTTPSRTSGPDGGPPGSTGSGNTTTTRSEERRVGKECRSRWAQDHDKKKN